MHSMPPRYSKLLHCLNIQATWQFVAERLNQAGIDDASREATIVLQHVTHQPPAEFFANLQRMLLPEEREHVEQILSRRLEREPLQYILKSACFYGRDFHVDARVLIPRPETELLVEHVLTRAPDLPYAVAPRMLDVGTGSGAIAITLACELENVQVVAIDRSAAALQVARANAAKHMVSDRVSFIQADLISAIGMQVDAIAANLPYIPTADIPGLSAEVSSFEPRAALDGGASGLDLIRVLCLQAPTLLKPDGWLFLEVGQHQAAEVAGLLSDVPIWTATDVLRDLRGIDRIVVARIRRHTAQ